MYPWWITVLFLCILSQTAELQTGKMPRGRKLKVDTGQLKEIFMKYAETCRKKDIKYNDPVFVNISKELNNVMTPMALHVWLKRNYKSVFGMPYIPDIEKSPFVQSSTSTPSSRSAASSPTKCQTKQKSTKQFTFLLDIHEWRKVEPISVYYVRRDLRTSSTHKRYKTLPKFKWASMLREKLWEFTRRPCTWVFKNKRIDYENNVFIKGKCSQCNAITKITSQAASTKTAVMTCTIIDDGNKVLHNPKKKSKLTPYRRHQLAKKLEYMPATVIHKTMGSKMINDNDDVNPPVLPSVEALRKIKHEKRQSHRLHSNTILSVLIMSTMAIYQNFIRQVTFVPNLNIYYWSDQQMQYYNTYLEKVANGVTITLDATGSFFQHIKLPNGSILTKRIFLYVAMLTSNSIKSTSIFQMITDSHTTESIHSWLKKWFLDAHIAPQEIITDDSSALIAANVSTFTSLRTVKEYLIRSFLVLTGKSNDLPDVFLRLDSSHFIKNIYNLRCFENVNDNIKMFYIRSILFIKTCESLEIIQTCISNIVKICLCKYDYTKNDDCQQSVKYIKSLLFNVEDATVEKGLTDTFDDYVSVPDDENVLDWFDEIVEKEKIRDQTPHESKEPNQYYLPNFVSILKRLLIKLPLWSNVMCPIYKSQNKSPSSSAVESYFKTLKHLLFQTRSNKYKIDEFLKIHCDFLTGETKIALNSLKTEVESSIQNRRKRKWKPKKHGKEAKIKKKDFRQKFSCDSIFSDEPSFTENWGGESNATKSNNKPSVLFLKNGNLSDSKCNIMNTCAFDSIFYMMAYGYQVNIYIRELFNSNILCNLIREFLNILTHSKNTNTAYKKREEIITKYYKNKNNFYECSSNVTYLFEHVLSIFLYSAKRSKECSTETCESYNTKLERNIVFISINMDIINTFGVLGLEDSIIIDDSEQQLCVKCNNKSAKYVYEFQNIVSFDLNGTEKILLVDVPQHIKVRRKTYKFIGAIEYISLCIGVIGHYKTHILINESEMLCYDDNKTVLHESSKEPMILHTLTYAAIDS